MRTLGDGSNMEKMLEEAALDQEWMELIKEAKGLGLTLEEIRLFLLMAEDVV